MLVCFGYCITNDRSKGDLPGEFVYVLYLARGSQEEADRGKEKKRGRTRPGVAG